MKKLIYILPEYNHDLDGHIYYLVNFVQEIAKDFSVFLIVEKSKEKKIHVKNISGYYTQRCSNIFLRSLELFFVVLWKRLC
jgi:uncharacterized membrane protein YiaA